MDMRNRFLDLKLNVKISLLGIVSVVVTALVLVALAVWQSGQYNDLARGEVDQLIQADLDHITQGVYNLVRTEDMAVQEQIDRNLELTRHLMASRGGAALSDAAVDWSATSQLTGETLAVRLPRMTVGGLWLGQNSDPSAATPIVDEFSFLTGETVTLFQRMNARGDMLRVATTVLDAWGRRAIGTYIPAVEPDGNPNPVINSIMKGDTYHGRAFVVDDWYLTAYTPVLDASGTLIGMLYVGIRLRNVESRVRSAILQIRVGETGYVYVLGGTGRDRGRYIISQKGERDGEDIWESRDTDGGLMVQKIIGTALGLAPGELATERYRWVNPGETTPRWKVARVAYYAPWDWVIGTSAYEDELQIYRAVLGTGRSRMIAIMCLAGVGITLLIGLAGILVAWSIARPVRTLTRAVETIILGSLDQTVDIPTRDEIGTLAATFNAMTRRLRETMEGLRESEENYRGIFENALEGIFQVSAEGRTLRASPALARMLGYDSVRTMTEHTVGAEMPLFARPEDGASLIADVAAQGTVIEREVRLLRADLTSLWVSLSARQVRDTAGGAPRIQGFAIDITDRKRVEAERETLIARLEAANAEMERFTYTVSHDLKSPLITIRGYLGYIVQSAREGDLGKLEEDAARVSSAAERMQRLLDELLEMSRLDHKRNPPVVAPFADIAREAQELLAGPLRRRGVRVEIEPDLPDVFGDRLRLRETVQNLLDNAIKFMGDQPSPLIRIGARSDGGRTVLFIEDNGIGIDPRFHGKVFDLFEKLDTASEGSGAGLAIVKRIIETHGGRVWVESEGAGRGSRFCFTLAPGGTETEREDAHDG
jgi:PAS domain S-box-containing protein